ncbi:MULTISPECIES: hypothetical protein [Pseudoalteromonas]|uniref:hypothetical protein n=1 Tax=Pseudoalteromonas TaxID=53246 RepID=UPI000348C710|nr:MULTISPECIES: hypothetical protein [Pseudoalteromonas]MCF2863276.1 hypothetical protein [Pseudoalteromonas sp. CNAT2-18]MCG7544255.1 hypothetical protein [Pseudoalteromonas sp. MM17-2]MCG7558229.1 hypothetical protein [Pseudoalteromonas sp. CNAT2-18.1]MCG7567844.1 hypothetical protein [Pseudoalteromonas sp. CnMc7-15]MCG7570784.1 hypothetical protein [Pseudoalteromonas sp. CNC9-20]
MLKRRRTHRFKRNVLFSSTNRRRVTRKNTHNKILWRRRLFAMQQMEELEKQRLAEA